MIILTAILITAAAAPLPVDPRYCAVAPVRASDGRIARSAAAKTAFRRVHPCPSTREIRGACPGWAVDHVIPLACGGCDAIGNLQWMPLPTKSASGVLPKDRWERPVYCHNGAGRA